MFKDKVLLITGGTGSFGNAVVEHFLKSEFAEIRVFSRDEKKQEDMRIAFRNDRLKFYIGDVREYDSVHDALRGVDYVFHAAALKQVPSCEFYPMEAVRTNVIGAENVMRAAIAHGVRRCVVLSTDKAVYPINAMGMSKAMMEKVMVARSRQCDPDRTVLCATRYGNVMASRGSVIPLFLLQLIEGRPLTITDPAMTRFLMSLEESVGLVLYAFEHARPGDIFVQKAPASTVGDLASRCANCSGATTRSRSSARATARSSTSRSCPARRWRARKTSAATTASPRIRATSTTTSTSSKARPASRRSTTTRRTTPCASTSRA